MADDEGLPWRRVEPAVSRFISCCQLDFDRLSQHRKNLDKLLRWEGEGQPAAQRLRQEQDNVVRTLQQLKTNLAEIEKLHRQLKRADRPRLAGAVEPVRERFELSLAELAAEPQLRPSLARRGLVVADASPSGDGEQQQQPPSLLPLLASSPTSSLDPAACRGGSLTAPDFGSDRIQVSVARTSEHEPAVEELRLAAQSTAVCEEISENLEDVRDMMMTLSTMLKPQGEQIDHIEGNIDNALANVSSGSRHLAQAAKWKAAVLPVVGALVGGVVGGPVGLLAGLKIGGLAALGGATVGAVAGTQIKKRMDRTVVADQQLADNAAAIPLTTDAVAGKRSTCTQAVK